MAFARFAADVLAADSAFGGLVGPSAVFMRVQIVALG